MAKEMSGVDRVDPEQWVDEYGDYLFRYANSRLRNVQGAEEVVQETFLSGIRYREQFTGRGSEQSWLIGILKRKIIDHIRKQARHNRTTPYEDQADPSTQLFDEQGHWKHGATKWAIPPDQLVESGELWDVVRQCIDRLPKGQSEVFTLSVMEELDSDEICETLGITASNLWVRLHRARLALANCVGARWFVEQEKVHHAK